MKIRQRLWVGFLLFVVLLWLAGATLVNGGLDMVRQVIGDNTLRMAQQTLEQIDHTISTRIEMVQGYAQHLGESPVLRQSNSEFREMDEVRAHIDSIDRPWKEGSSADVNALIASISGNELSACLRDVFQADHIKKSYGYSVFPEAFVTNQAGVNVGQTGRTSDYYQADERWWQQAKEAGVYIGGIGFDASTGAYSVDIAVRISDSNGAFAGVLKAVWHSRELFDQLDQIHRDLPYKKARLRLFDRKGAILFDQGLEPGSREISLAELFSRIRQSNGYFFWPKGLLGKSTLISYTVSRGFRQYAGSGWVLVLEADAAEVFAPIWRIWIQALIILLAATLLAVAVRKMLFAAVDESVKVLEGTAADLTSTRLHESMAADSDLQELIEVDEELGGLAARIKGLAADVRDRQAEVMRLNARIAALEEAKQALEDGEVRLKRAELLGAMGYWEWDMASGKTLWSDGLYRLFDRDPAEGPPTRDDMFSTYDSADALQLQIQAKMGIAVGEPRGGDYLVHLPTGRYAYQHVSMVRVDDPQGGVTGLCGVIQDVTDRCLAEQVVTRAKQELGQILAASGPLCMVDADGTLRQANEAFCAMIGRPQDQVLGRKCHEVIPETRCGTQTCPLKRVLAESGPFTYETTLKVADRELALRAAATPFVDGDTRRVTGVVLYFIDRAVAQEARHVADRGVLDLERANHELQAMQSRLEHNEKLASIGELAAGIAQEMDTPVGFVAGHFDALQTYMTKVQTLVDLYEQMAAHVDPRTYPPCQDDLRQIDQARRDMKIDSILQDVQHLFEESKQGLDAITSTIRSLRSFASTDQIEPLEEYNLNDGLQTTLAVSRGEIKSVAEVRLDLGRIPSLSCHANEINQVLLNLLTNAVQAIRTQGRPDKGTIAVRTYATETDVVCEIADNGPGIAPEHLPRVFEPFFTTKPAGVGRGLGLSACHDIIVHKHHGQITAKSTVGEGATFTIRLPLRPADVPNHGTGLAQAQNDGPPEDDPIRGL